VFVQLGADASGFMSTMGRMESRMRRFTSGITRSFSRLARYGAMGAAAYTAASIKAFATFEEQMANVSTMLDEHTMRFMPAYTKAVKNMAVEFGEGTDTITKGLYDILSASIEPAHAMDVLRTSMMAAKGGMTTTAIAADAITTILNSYQLEAKQADYVSDVLFATVKRGKITFGELASGIGMVVSVASTAGLAFEEVGAAIATMTRAGMPAQRAITALRAIISSMLSPTKESIIAAEEYGLELSSVTLKTEGLVGVIQKLSKASAEQIAAIFPNIRAMTGLAAQVKQVAGQVEDLRFMFDSTGKSQEAYAKMTDIVAHHLRRFWQALKMISVEFGERFKDHVKGWTAAITENWKAISRWAQDAADAFIFVGESVADFVKIVVAEPGKALGELVQLFWSTFKFIGKMAISMGYRIGQSIWEGIRRGIFGEREATQREILAEYQKMAQVIRERGAKGILDEKSMFVTDPTKGRFGEMLGVDRQVWAMAKLSAQAKVSTSEVDSLVGKLYKDMSKYADDFVKEGEASWGTYFDAWKENWDKMLEGMRGRKEAFIAENAMEQFKKELGPIARMVDGIKAGFITTYRDIQNRLNPALSETKDIMRELTAEQQASLDRVRSMIEELQQELELVGKVNEERERAVRKQEFLNELGKVYNSQQKEYYEMVAQYEQLIAQIGKAERMAERTEALERWAEGAREVWTNLSQVAANSLDQMADNMANFLAGNAVDWRSWAASVLMEINKIIIKMLMIRAFEAATGWFGGFSLFGMSKSGTIGMGSPGAGGYHQARFGRVIDKGQIKAFQMGGVLQQATLLPLKNREMALAAEEQPEAIMPLSRDRTGRLGVRAEGTMPAPTVVNLKNVNVFDRTELYAAMQSAEGERILLNVLSRKGVI